MTFATTQMDLEIKFLSEVRERQILWYHLYVESKKKWYKWAYLQNINRPTDSENKFMVTKDEM